MGVVAAGRSGRDRKRALVRGAAAGAAGVTALNAVTYLDMLLRGRPASGTPEETADRLAGKVGVPVPGDGDRRRNRLSGAGALMGLTTGLGVGLLLGAAQGLGWRPSLPVAAAVTGAAAMAGTDGAMTALGVTDPRRWGLAGWVSDAVPHLAYGVVTAAVLRAMRPGRRRR